MGHAWARMGDHKLTLGIPSPTYTTQLLTAVDRPIALALPIYSQYLLMMLYGGLHSPHTPTASLLILLGPNPQHNSTFYQCGSIGVTMLANAENRSRPAAKSSRSRYHCTARCDVWPSPSDFPACSMLAASTMSCMAAENDLEPTYITKTKTCRKLKQGFLIVKSYFLTITCSPLVPN